MVSDATKDKRAGRKGLALNAKRMRREPTEAEARFWHYAKNAASGESNSGGRWRWDGTSRIFCARSTLSSWRSTAGSMARRATDSEMLN
jgi:hypothetical protein